MITDRQKERIKTGIVDHCLDDLAQFLEVDWIAIEDAGIKPLAERRTAIVDAIMELVAERQIEVGDVENTGNFLDFRPWPEKGEDLRERLRRVTTDIISPELGEGFWLARTQPDDCV